MKPGEVQFVTYGKDLDVEVARTLVREESKPQAIILTRGDQVELHSLRKREVSLTLENRSGAARSVHVRLDVGSNAAITGADAVDFDLETENALAVFEVKARSKRAELLHIAEGRSRAMRLSSLDQKQLAELAAVDGLTAPQRQALVAARTIVRRNGDDLAELEAINRTRAEKEKDIERLRKHLGALGGEGGRAPRDNPFVQRLVKAEDEVERLQERTRQLEKERQGWAEQLRETLKPFAR
jgi:hypothetical protein